MKLADALVPAGALRLPARPTAEAEVLRWFGDLGIVIPPARPIGIRWTDHGAEHLDEDTVAAMSDEERDRFDGVIVTPDTPDLETLAAGVVHIANERHEQWPGPFSWRRWRLTGRVASFLYVSGICRSGGSTEWGGWDPYGTARYDLPSWRDVLPRRGGQLRPYVLWLPDWWWSCQRRQGWRLRGRHRPRRPFAFGICAACLPCWSCGALYECRPGCSLWTGEEVACSAQASTATVAP